MNDTDRLDQVEKLSRATHTELLRVGDRVSRLENEDYVTARLHQSEYGKLTSQIDSLGTEFNATYQPVDKRLERSENIQLWILGLFATQVIAGIFLALWLLMNGGGGGW